MARMGAIVWAYDAVGYGQMEEIGWGHRDGEVLKLQLWNSIRSVDFMLSLGADPDKLAVTGASGGGTQSFLLAAVDDRIDVAAPVVMVSAHFLVAVLAKVECLFIKQKTIKPTMWKSQL